MIYQDNNQQALVHQIAQLEERLTAIENKETIFPQRLSQVAKRNINNVSYIVGQATINVAGNATIPIDGLSNNNVILVSCGVGGSGSVNGSIYGGAIHLEGTFNDTVQYIVFITTDIDPSNTH